MSRIFRLAALVALLCITALLTNRTPSSTATGSGPVSVIVELRDEPAAVHAARARAAGAQLSAAQLQAYRDGLRARQDEFLRALSESGVAATLRAREIKGFDGATAGRVELRYTLVYNGLSLAVPRAAVPAVAAMPQVKRVHANTRLYPNLHASVD